METQVQGHFDIDFIKIYKLSTFRENDYVVAKISFRITVFLSRQNHAPAKKQQQISITLCEICIWLNKKYLQHF